MKTAVDPVAAKRLADLFSADEVDWLALDADELLPTREDWETYEARLNRWIGRVHAAHPVSLFFKPTWPDANGDQFSPWHEWTVAQPDALRAALGRVDEDAEPEAPTDWIREVLDL